jgi:iron complex outermembrane receptor protein
MDVVLLLFSVPDTDHPHTIGSPVKTEITDSMKSLLLFSLLSIYFFSSPAQTNLKNNFSGFNGSLTGKVVDSASGTAIAGASVYFADLKLGALTDAGGNYKFANLPSGTYLVEAHAIGHSAQIKNFTVSAGAVLDFSLGLQYTEESPVVVTGLSKATQIKRSQFPSLP